VGNPGVRKAGIAFPDPLEDRSPASSESLDRFDPVAHRYRDRIDDVSLVAKYQPLSVSFPAFSVWDQGNYISAVPRLDAKIRTRVRLWPAEHFVVSRVAGDSALVKGSEVDFAMGQHCGAGNVPRCQS
jgi:hypothetical protein